MSTQREISKALGISEQLFSMIKKGDRNITYQLAKKLNELTRIEVDFFMETKGIELKESLEGIEIKTREVA